MPGELAAAGDRLYFGGDDGRFYAYRLTAVKIRNGLAEVNVNVVGVPVVDDRCVYAAFMDNAVRAFRHGPGNSLLLSTHS